MRVAANPTAYVLALEKAFEGDIDHFRFFPYLQLHEYETILFETILFADLEVPGQVLPLLASSYP
jgi:hypothetical protein